MAHNARAFIIIFFGHTRDNPIQGFISHSEMLECDVYLNNAYATTDI